MPSTAKPTPRRALRRGGSPHAEILREPSTVASVQAWIKFRLLDTTARIAEVQPMDPLRALSVRLGIEAILLGPYPLPPTPAAQEKAFGEEMSGVDCVVATDSEGISTQRPQSTPRSWKRSGTHAKKTRRHSPPLPTVGRLVEEAWVRSRLQPHALRAVAHCLCPCLPLSSSSSAVATATDAAAATGLGEACRHPQTMRAFLLRQWMDIFALLHRQSRLSWEERAAVSAHHTSMQEDVALSPPVDFRATEEVPAWIVLLVVMAVIEEHIRPAECGGATPEAVVLCQRQQLSVKLLALRLLLGLVAQQNRKETSLCFNASSASDREGHGMGAMDGKETPAGEGTLPNIPHALYGLPAEELETFHRWFHHRLRRVVSLASPFSGISAITAATGEDNGKKKGVARRTSTALAMLQRHAEEDLQRVVRDHTNGGAGDETTINVPPVVLIDTFAALMDCLAAFLVLHQHAAMSMVGNLSARIATSSFPLAEDAFLPAWVVELLGKCTAYLAEQHVCQPQRVAPSDLRTDLPLVWKMHVHQIFNVLEPYRRDVEEAEGLDRLARNLRLIHPSLPGVIQGAGSNSSSARQNTSENGARHFSIRTLTVVDAVCAWVSEVCHVYMDVLYASPPPAVRR